MSAIADSRLPIDYLQVGKGRLAQLICNKVAGNLKLEVNFARLDPSQGLVLPEWTQDPLLIEKMVVCIAPPKSSAWQWSHILKGLLKQVKQKRVTIKQLIFISSTRVYDGIESGLVNSKTNPVAGSASAKALLIAEQDALQLATKCQIVRCSGLYSHHTTDYQVYRNILKQTAKQPRFGVDIEMVANHVVRSLTNQSAMQDSVLLTDGYCYFENNKIPIDEALSMAQHYKILIPTA